MSDLIEVYKMLLIPADFAELVFYESVGLGFWIEIVLYYFEEGGLS